LPLVLGLGDAIAALGPDTTALVDGAAGTVVVDPRLDEIEAATRSATAAAAVDREPRSGATHGVGVVANVASALEAGAAARAGADGIGLVRTELLFVGRAGPPTVAEQRATYAAIRAAMGERPVVFRTLDIGGDKPATWRDSVGSEPNPALGVRGVRLGLRQHELLDAQFRALVEAADGRDLRVMLPMVATVEEVTAARHRLDATVAAWTAEGGSAPDPLLLGVMIEVPAAAVMADAFAEVADFFSIGTNDLVQYTLAADRTNPELADLATPLQPAVLRLIDGVVRAAGVRSRPVAVCGEAAADPAVIPLLVGLGVDELSVSPGSVPVVLRRLEMIDPAAWQDAARRALGAASLPDVLAIAGALSPDPARDGQEPGRRG
jgi:phosphoenolpyruvate-protein kinase (PTS system EI component)